MQEFIQTLMLIVYHVTTKPNYLTAFSIVKLLMFTIELLLEKCFPNFYS